MVIQERDISSKEDPRRKKAMLMSSRRGLPIKERLVDTLGEVAAFPSVADGKHDEAIQGLFDYVDARVAQVEKETGKKFIRKTWNNQGILSTIITPEDPNRTEEETIKHPQIAVLTHGDVVDAENPDMFVLQQDGDKLKVRGGLDMKGGGLVPILEMLDELPVGAALILTSDEENAGAKGAGFLAQTVGLEPGFLIIIDGQKPEHLSFGSKGVWHTKVTFKSALDTGGHGSRYEDYSANELTGNFMRMLREYFPWYYSNSPEGTTINFGKVVGGLATNKIAQETVSWIDMRFPSETDRELGKKNYSDALRHTIMNVFEQLYPQMIYASVFKSNVKTPPIKLIESEGKTEDGGKVQIWNIMDGITGISYEVARVETLGDAPVYAIDRNNPQVKHFAEILGDVTGKGVSINDKDTGAHDGRYFPRVPAAVYLLAGGGAHTSQEWVSAESLVQTYEVIKRFLHEELAAA